MVDLNIIKQIESSGNPKAFNKRSEARGLYQITPVVLEEWNNLKRIPFEEDDLFDPVINQLIADWYMNTRIPAMLKAYKLPDTLENRLWAYNAGIGRVRKGELPEETRRYIEKYKQFAQRKNEIHKEST